MSSRDEAAASGCKWFPHKKGGPYRKWYGNNDFVINWEHDGAELWAFATEMYGSPTRILKNTDKYFRPGVTWSHTTSSQFSARAMEIGFIANVEAPSLYSASDNIFLAILCSSLMQNLLKLTNPTLHFVSSSVARMPYSAERFDSVGDELRSLCDSAVEIAREDWDLSELSWRFRKAWWQWQDNEQNLQVVWREFADRAKNSIAEMRALEERNNQTVALAYGLADELTPEVPIEQITLTVNPAYRYGGKLKEDELNTRFREDTMQELISYAIGCMMGRYSLDAAGLIYAHGGNKDFDSSRYATFPADDDGIVPITDTDWFDDDACNRIIEFISVAWDASHLEDNLTFLSENLNPKSNESSRETLRRYLCDSLFKDHLKTYKKRPIYWLFSSGKQKAFQCLVYLHRYNEGTLARMRTEYVIPLQGKMIARIDHLASDIQQASSTSHRKKLERERDTLLKQQTELRAFDEKLRHYADKRINLDLDDGVKVNYGKFGDLLAEVKAVTGGKAED